MTEDGLTPSDLPQRWAKVLDQDKCIGCHACTTACKSENQVPPGVTRTYVKSAEVGTFPQVRRAFPGDPVQSVRGRALHNRVPDRGDVPAAPARSDPLIIVSGQVTVRPADGTAEVLELRS